MKNIQISILDTSTSNLDLELSSINVEKLSNVDVGPRPGCALLEPRSGPKQFSLFSKNSTNFPVYRLPRNLKPFLYEIYWVVYFNKLIKSNH